MTLALYRKYRPQIFAEVIGQEHVTEPLISAISNGRLNHAYLFSGPRGCGKTSSARILARSLNCAKGPTPTPCGQCESCIGLSAGGGGSIDVIEIDAASHGGVDDARELRERAVFAPVSSRFKIYVIDEAHMVSSAGFNALLKLVEEPPDYVMFVFATTEPEKVLPTIRSRTHHYPFRLIPPAAMRGLCERLCEEEGITVAEAVYPLVIRAGAGSARDTLSVLDQLIAGAGDEGVTYARAVSLLGVTDGSLLDGICEALSAMDGAGAIGVIDKALEAGHDPRRFTSDLLERLRDLIVLNQVPDAGSTGLIDVPSEVLERMTGQAIRMGTPTLTRMADIFHNALSAMRGTTAPRLLLELACARAVLPSVDDSAAGLLQRIDQLERRFAEGVPMATPHAASPAAQEPQAAAPTGLTGREAAKAAAAAASSNVPATPRTAPAGPSGPGGGAAVGSHDAGADGQAASPATPSADAAAGNPPASGGAAAGPASANAAASGQATNPPGPGGPAVGPHDATGQPTHPPGHDGGTATAAKAAAGQAANPPVHGDDTAAGPRDATDPTASVAAVGQAPSSTSPNDGTAAGSHGTTATDQAAGTATSTGAGQSSGQSTGAVASAAATDQAASVTPPDHTHPSTTVAVSATTHGGAQSDAGAAPAAHAQPPTESAADGSAPAATATSAPGDPAGTGGEGSADTRPRDSRPSAAAAAASWGDAPAATPARAGTAATASPGQAATSGGPSGSSPPGPAASTGGPNASARPSQTATSGGPSTAAPPGQTATAAPPNQAAPASGSDKLAQVRGSWEQVKQAVKDRKKTVAAFLMEATVTAVDGDTLVLTFRHAFHANALTSDASMPIFTSALSSVLGGSWRVRCEIAEAGAAPPARVPAARPAPAAAAPPSPRPAEPGPAPSMAEEPLPPEPEDYDAPPAASANGSVTMEQAVEMFAKKVGAKKI